MDQAIEDGKLTEKNMLRIMYFELKELRRQSEDQQRQLKHLRRDLWTATRGRPDNALQTSTTTNFTDLPLEIREMIWEQAVPSRLVRFLNAAKEGVVPSALPVPTVAHVCQESRRIFLSPKRVTNLLGKLHRVGDASQLWHLQHSQLGAACWTWFTPYKDILFIDTDLFSELHRKKEQSMLRVAEHVVIDDRGIWADSLPLHVDGQRLYVDHQADEGVNYEGDEGGNNEGDEGGNNEGDEDGNTSEEEDEGDLDEFEDERLSRLYCWWRDVMPKPEYPPPPGGPSWNLRTIDFAMTSVTTINKNYPPNFVHRLFAEESVRIVDLRDHDAVRGIEQMLEDEISQFGPPDKHALWRIGLRKGQKIFKAANAPSFEVVRANLLEEMAVLYHRSSFLDPEKSRPTLPSPLNSKGKLNMKVRWVKEFTERLTIRPVHVFVRVNGRSNDVW